MSGARLCPERSLSSGLSVSHLSTSSAAEEGPGYPPQHQLLTGGLRHLPLLRSAVCVCVCVSLSRVCVLSVIQVVIHVFGFSFNDGTFLRLICI